MKKKISFSFISVLIFLCSAAQNRSSVLLIKKVTAEEVKTIMDTTSVPLIVNFWASWCGPCVREIPWFERIISEKNSAVKLLLVSLDFPTQYPGQLTAFVQKQGYKGEIVFLDETNTHHYVPIINKKWTGEIPSSIFINNSRKYYKIFNQQLPPKRFELELDKLME